MEQEERDAEDHSARSPHSPRSPRSPRTPRTPQTPRVEVNGTGREIDDYSSDNDGDDKKNKVISMEGVEAETKPIRRHRPVSSSSDNSDSDGRQQRRGQTNTIISVDLLDKEEREQENARKDKAKRDELQRQEADELFQRQRRENAQRREEERRAEEARRQEDRYEQQQREEARRRREEQRRLEAEQERQQRDEQEESRRRALLIEQDAQAREEERLRAQRLREEQIMEEQRQREARRREEERAREERWREEQARREERRRKEEEERAERKRQLEEGSSSARTESSTARTSSSEASSSSEESTPRRTGQSELTAHGERERAASPLPPAAVYEDRRQLRGDSAPPPQRPVSPLPPAAVYQERPKRRQETVTVASTQPVPEAAVYRERPRFPATEEPAPVIGLDVQPPSPDEPRKQHTARSSSSATQDSSSSSEEEEEEKEESQFQVDQQGYLKKTEEDDEASHPNLRYQSKRSDEVSDSEEEEAGAARYQRNQQASKRAEDEDSGTADSSSDSTSSSGSDSDRSITKDSAADSQHVQDTTEADVSGENPDSHVRTTSESDGENMHGGADPDNVAQQETVGELLPLRTRELPAAKSHDGKVSELLTSRESVELSNVLLNKTQVYEVASHLEQADTVKMISLCNTGLDDDDMQRLSEAITASPSEPVMLNLSLNALTQKSVKHVLNVLKAKPSIKLLILQSNPMGDKGAEELVQGLQDLHRQARANRHATATAATADSNTADTLSMDSSASSNIDPVTASRRYLLQELDLTDTGLCDKGAEHVAQLLANNIYVESLGLSHNGRISAQDGWSHIGEALAKNRCLRTLSLDGNHLGDEGVEHLARGLRSNRGLRSLMLEDAGVGVEGGKRLMEMLKRNTTLLELTLSPGNSIPDELVEDIKKYIALNRAPYDNFGV